MPSLADITVKPDLFPEGKQKQWVWERKGVKGDGRGSYCWDERINNNEEMFYSFEFVFSMSTFFCSLLQCLDSTRDRSCKRYQIQLSLKFLLTFHNSPSILGNGIGKETMEVNTYRQKNLHGRNSPRVT